MAMVVGLGLLGVGFSSWSDTLNIDATVETGTWEQVELSKGSCSQNVTCLVDPADTLNIDITNASPGYNYFQGFDIHNLGTVPVKIEDIQILASPQITATVSDVSVGDQIEQNGVSGDTVYGTVNMPVTEAGSYTCNVTFSFVPWNQ